MKYIIYFLIGGTVVTVVTYLASYGKGLLAAFIANLPTITVVTFFTIYISSGENAVISYAKGLVIMLIPWISYISSIIFLIPKVGFYFALGIGIIIYIFLAFILLKLF